MDENRFDPETSPKQNRRGVVGGMLACAISAGLADQAAGASPSNNSICPVDDATTASQRALLSLWLLLTTNPDFVSETTPLGGTTAYDLKIKRTDLMSDLSHLPSAPNGSSSFLDAVLGRLSQKASAADISYAGALRAVQELFQFAGKLQPQSGQPVYSPGEPGCPKTVDDILRVATRNPVSKFPQS